MPSPKPRNASYKDSLVVFLCLKAHFAIADNHPKEENRDVLAKLMLENVPNYISLQAEPWRGEYYSACKLFLHENAAEIAQNAPELDMEQLLKAQGSPHWSGESLWKRVIDSKHEMLNQVHTIFCQEVNPIWLCLPSGKKISDLLGKLRKKLFTKKKRRNSRTRSRENQTSGD